MDSLCSESFRVELSPLALEDDAVQGCLVSAVDLEVIQTVGKRCLHDQPMDYLSTTGPVVEGWHFLSHPHNVAQHFDAFDRDWNVY